MSTIIVFVLRFPSKRRFVKEIVAYQILFCVATLEAGFINHADGGNEKIKKTAFLIRMKTKILNVQDTFSQISLSSLHDLFCQT